MAKRKKAKSPRKSSATRKSTGGTKRARRTRSAKSTQESQGAPPASDFDAALTPAPALPVAERGGKRERETRGGKPTLSTHELLAEVPPPPRAKPASRPKGNARPRPTPYPAPSPAPVSQPTSPAQQPFSQAQIYEMLAALLVPYARRMESEMHPKIGFCLKAKSARTGRETHFGAVQALPDGVAFHLFPLYAHPDLLEGVSPELFTRLRGKTCFHFESLHAGQLAELAQLTHAGFERFLADGVF